MVKDPDKDPEDVSEPIAPQTPTSDNPISQSGNSNIVSSLLANYSTTNRKSRRRLIKSISKVYQSNSKLIPADLPASTICLKRIMARPPGSSFLGSKAVCAEGHLLNLESSATRVVIDSGSDITLISADCLKTLKDAPKAKTGQKINLTQVTGSTSINGFITLPVFFDTPDGPVMLEVEAYVVKGMTTPFILGNDFADQYELSIMRKEGKTHLILGDSGRTTEVNNSLNASQIDSSGKSFNVRIQEPRTGKIFQKRVHKYRQRRDKAKKKKLEDKYLRAAETVTISGMSGKNIPLLSHNIADDEDILAERLFNFSTSPEDSYAAPHVLFNSKSSYLPISNFSSRPVVIRKGQALAIKRKPGEWLDEKDKVSNSTYAEYETHALAIKALVESFGHTPDLTIPHNPGDEPIEGGPKTSEAPPDEVREEDWLKKVDISKGLTDEQRKSLEEILKRNVQAFGLNNRLGEYPANVTIRLKPDAAPISLPPFGQSPANREVVNEQIDKWLAWGIIEPSASPWGAPAFIVYRNGKPRMVIDYRRLNQMVIADEFPLPKQDDILQALTGAQFLSTLDALSGFHQLEMAEKDREILAFRCHRGLFHFKRMPLGYRNGPAVFQRVMQSVLAPYLWIFSLVYIDDIVIYSKTLKDHLEHIDTVLQAVSKSGITLSPAKCHFAYQSLALLGQKVSRLGMSTDKAKVDAILALEPPRGTQELHTFLGMMVYFSAYIPFYAWIVTPLFALLKKNAIWRWTDLEQEAFNLSKEVLTSAPVRAYAIPGLGYRLYSDACDYGLAAILQQIQPIRIRDLKGTKTYEKLLAAFEKGECVPKLVVPIGKEIAPLHPDSEWDAENFENSVVYIERVIAYWSRTLKSAERNYSPTEREALALKEGLIKFQAYIEGEQVDAITDHAALTWSRTFQNLNRRLLTWGTVFSAYPNLRIVHRAGRVHSNVDPISRLRRRVPIQEGPDVDNIESISLIGKEDPLTDFYSKISAKFESRVLNLAAEIVTREEEIETAVSTNVPMCTANSEIPIEVAHQSSCNFNISVHLSKEEIDKWRSAYLRDPHTSAILQDLKEEENWITPKHPLYCMSDDGLLFWEDWEGNLRLYVPKDLRVEIMTEDHESPSGGAHSGYHKAYNRLALTYYWPRMGREVRKFISTCDICQKAKPKRHAPFGMLRPIPIPSRPFEMISMDFIPELPMSKTGHNNILVIVDKLTKYGTFIPCDTSIDAEGTARLVFEHIITRFGIPFHLVADRDPKWAGPFWEQICKSMGIKRALTTSYHPQADGQTEILNQTLETALRCYINPERDDWDEYLASFSIAYNSTPHLATGFAPAFLLYGYLPTSGTNMLGAPTMEVIGRPLDPDDAQPQEARSPSSAPMIDGTANQMLAEFEYFRTRAKDAISLSQTHQQRGYNRGRLAVEFEVGDHVLINPHSLRLLGKDTGRGKKLLMKYDGPFEIQEKYSPVTYRLKLPSSYQIHPVINIAHLEPYKNSPEEFGPRLTRSAKRADQAQVEYEVFRIIDEQYRKRGARRVPYYKLRWEGFGPEYDTWEPKSHLRNAPEVIREWLDKKKAA